MPRYAAVDIGSNSVRLQVAEVGANGAPPRILAADREVTRLGSSVFRTGSISEEAIQNVSNVLRRMATTYRSFDVVGIRAVATAAVRDASNQEEFIHRVSEAIGVRVEIISGLEEARLIHMGVNSRWPQGEKRVLVVDVGGGSAELIYSERGQILESLSRPLGAVRLSEIFMKSDPPQDSELHRLQQFIDEKLERAVEKIGSRPIERVIATSATASAIICAVNRVPRPRREEADRLRATTAQIREFYNLASHEDVAARRKIIGIGPRRADIIVAGTAVFLRILETFRLRSMHFSLAGVRDGVIADLAGRGVGRELSRLSAEQLRTVRTMARKYSTALERGRKIATFSHLLFDTLHPFHRLPPHNGKLLESAAYLHDVGHFVSATGHHKHSAYLVQNSDMPGFTDRERLLIALLCRYHRKTMPTARHPEFQALAAEEKRTVQLLTPILRMSHALDTSEQQKVENIFCDVNDGAVTVRVEAEGDIDLEMWEAERAADSFRQVYGIPVEFVRQRRRPV